MKPSIYFYLSTLAFTVVSLYANSQNRSIDSLQNELGKTNNDSVTIFLYTQLANEYFPYDTVIAYHNLQKGFQLARKMKWDYALGDYYEIKGQLKQLSSAHVLAHVYLDSAILYYRRAAKTGQSKKTADDINLSIATCLAQKADILTQMGKGEEAIAIYLAVLDAWKSSNQARKDEAIGTYYSRISSIYYGLKEHDKALAYDRRSLSQYLTTDNKVAIAWAYIYVCDDFIALNQLDSCLHYLAKAKPLVLEFDNHRLNVQYYNKLGQISLEQKAYRAAIVHFKKCIEEATFTDTKFLVLSNQRMVAVCHIRLAEYDAARKYLLLAWPEAVAGNYVKAKIEILQDLVTTEEKSNHEVAAYSYLKQVVVLRDSMSIENSKKAVAEIENKYQANEKAKEIIQLKTEKDYQNLVVEKKTTSIYVLIGGLAAILTISLLGYLNFKNKQKRSRQHDLLQRQQIKDLEMEKQLIAYNSLLRGQEEERSRMAKDLHDGLGSMLGGVKLSLGAMKGNIILSEENSRLFTRALDELDHSIGEMRRVAHNMMPEALIRLGLRHAVDDYCNSLAEAGRLQFKAQFYGLENRLEVTTEVIVYRIVQEVVNNIIKHAAATEVLLQIMRHEHNLHITVEDNGKGFATQAIHPGSGLSNIRLRVDYLKGHLDIQSAPGNGTSILIDCPL